MQQPVTAVPFVKNKRDEMTFGYLPDHVLPDLVPDMTGSARFCSTEEVRNLMMQMDSGFVGMRRSVIDATQAVRQLILYTIPTQWRDGEFRVAVYQRAVGSDPNLQGSCSFGLGGHVEPIDMQPHMNENLQDPNGEPERIMDCPSSFFSTVQCGLREFGEEAEFLLPPGKEVPMTPQAIATAVLHKFDMVSMGNSMMPNDTTWEETIDGAVFHNDRFAILRDEGDATRGLLVLKKGPVGYDDVYQAVFGQPAVSNIARELDAELVPCGFLSDIQPDNPKHVGNTHIAVLGVINVPGDLDFRVKEEKYTTIGWMNKDELLANRDRFEPWSKILLDHLDDIAHYSRVSNIVASDAVEVAPAAEEAQA